MSDWEKVVTYDNVPGGIVREVVVVKESYDGKSVSIQVDQIFIPCAGEEKMRLLNRERMET